MNNRSSHIFYSLCLLLPVIIITMLLYPCHATDDKGKAPTVEEKSDSTNQEIKKQKYPDRKDDIKPVPEKSSDQPDDNEENPWDDGQDMGC